MSPKGLPSKLPFSVRFISVEPFGFAVLIMAILVLTPGCRQGEAEGASLGLEQALRDTRASLAAIGMAPRAEGAANAQSAALPPPPSAGTPRRAGVNAPAAAASLQGRDPEDVISALGEPALRRREGDAEVWLYQAPDCRLDLVFYPGTSRLVLAHAAARAHGARRQTEAACMASIATAPHPSPWTVQSGGG